MSDIMDEWLKSVHKSVKQSTFQKYDSIVKNHIKTSPIANIDVSLVNTKDLLDFSEDLSENKKLSSKTINDILVVIGLGLKFADEVYNIPKPNIKYYKTTKKEMRVLSVDEPKILEQYLLEDMNDYKLGILLALYTGIRLGKLCALEWKDVDTEKIVINKTLQRIKNGNHTELTVTPPKTRNSKRVIPIPRFLNPILEKRRKTGTVIKNSKGKAIEPRLMQSTFEKYIRDCKLPKTNFHALRHTFATRCIESGFDVKSLSDILGHSDVKTTLNRYVHSSMEQKRKNMGLLKPMFEF